jgi:hypothetical protein
MRGCGSEAPGHSIGPLLTIFDPWVTTIGGGSFRDGTAISERDGEPPATLGGQADATRSPLLMTIGDRRSFDKL